MHPPNCIKTFKHRIDLAYCGEVLIYRRGGTPGAFQTFYITVDHIIGMASTFSEKYYSDHLGGRGCSDKFRKVFNVATVRRVCLTVNIIVATLKQMVGIVPTVNGVDRGIRLPNELRIPKQVITKGC